MVALDAEAAAAAARAAQEGAAAGMVATNRGVGPVHVWAGGGFGRLVTAADAILAKKRGTTEHAARQSRNQKLIPMKLTGSRFRFQTNW
jgi:hypothetical protein